MISPKPLLSSLAWILPFLGGIVSLCLIVAAWRSWRVSHHHLPAFLLNAMVLIVIGMGCFLLNDAYGWSSAVLMLIASLLLLSGLLLIVRHLPRA